MLFNFKINKMKKIKILSAATILLAATGCQQDDLFQQPTGHGDGSVGVNTNVVNSTRGFALNNVDDLIASGNGFDLFAFESDGNQFMGTQSDGIEFAYNNGWDYVNNGEVKFWQQVADGNTVDFYAVSPANTSGITMASDSQTINFTVNDISADQKDLMYAHSTPVDPDDTEVIDNGVHLDFYHALSQIVFKARTADEFIFAEVHGIEIVNLHNQGIFTLANAAFDNFTADVTPWQITSDDATASYTAEIAAPIAVNTNLNDEATENDEPAVITDSSTALLLLPQPVTGSFNEDKTVQPSDGGTYLRVNCVVKYQGTSDADETTIFSAEDGSAADLYIPVNSEWKAGYKYTYTIVFSRDVADPVTINEDLYVGPWYEDENSDNGATEETTIENIPTNLYYDYSEYAIQITSVDDLVEARGYINEGASYIILKEVNADGYYRIGKVVADNISEIAPYSMNKVSSDEGDSELPIYQFGNSSYLQTTDLNLGEAEGEDATNWTPIGTEENPFSGWYYGQNHTISNLTITESNATHTGLFGYAVPAQFDGIYMSNVKIGTIDSPIGSKYAAAICGNGSQFTNCHILSGEIYGNNVAGIVANGNNSFCSSCSNNAIISGSGNAAGIYAGESGDISQCTNTNTVTSTGGYASGITISTSEISDSSNSGNISGYSDTGGIVAHQPNKSSKISASYNTGAISSSTGHAGGIAGYTHAYEIIGCYNAGKNTITASSNAGGLIGWWGLSIDEENPEQQASMTSCYSIPGSLTGTQTGALVGLTVDASTVTYTYCFYSHDTATGIGGKADPDDVSISQSIYKLGTKDIWYQSGDDTDEEPGIYEILTNINSPLNDNDTFYWKFVENSSNGDNSSSSSYPLILTSK